MKRIIIILLLITILAGIVTAVLVLKAKSNSSLSNSIISTEI